MSGGSHVKREFYQILRDGFKSCDDPVGEQVEQF